MKTQPNDKNPYTPLESTWMTTRSPLKAVVVVLGMLAASAVGIYVIYGWDKLLGLLSYLGF